MLKILIVSALTKPLQDEYYAPVERQVCGIARGLRARGFDVSVVALRGSRLGDGVELVEVQDGDEEGAYSSYKGRLREFDSILDFSNLKYSYLFKHDEDRDLRLIGAVYPYQGQGYSAAPPVAFPCFVGTSDAHAQSLSLRFGVAARHVYYGTPVSEGLSQRGDRMLYLGRLLKEKGPQIAIDVARQLRVGLDIIGEDSFIPDQGFPIQLLQRCDGRLVRAYGRVGESMKRELLSKARCVLLPYLSDEVAYTCLPAIESLAHGVPVVALRRGCIAEVVKDGVNGFAVSRVDQLAEAVRRVDEIDPSKCLESAKQFSLENSVSGYERLIKFAVNDGGW